MTHQLSIADIIALWPRQEDLASDCGVGRFAVIRWKQRNSIPAKYFAAMLSAAERRGIELTADQLATAAFVPPKKCEYSVKVAAQ